MKNKSFCIIITGTITPQTNYVAINNRDIRINEYYNNLIYYLQKFSLANIYFLENSEFDFNSNNQFCELKSNFSNLHYINCPISNKFSEGKGYQEFQMIDYALEKLEYDYFIKLTGRYRILNIDDYKQKIPTGILIDLHHKSKTAITSFFICKKQFYQNYLKNKYVEANDGKGIMIENVLYDELQKLNSIQVKLLHKSPINVGISGSYGKPIGKNRWKLKIRNIERFIFNLIGIKEFPLEY